MTTTSSAVDTDETRRAKIKEIVCEILEIDPGEMTGTSLFKEDHGADLMGAIEILSSLERTLGVDIDQNELARMVNLDSVVAVVEEARKAQQRPEPAGVNHGELKVPEHRAPREVVITGLGMVTGIGIGVEDFAAGLRNGRSGVRSRPSRRRDTRTPTAARSPASIRLAGSRTSIRRASGGRDSSRPPFVHSVLSHEDMLTAEADEVLTGS
ncbi:phosphopantetheine-binding protein [Amycolatopsis halotolerans]|uniref:Phosphopantetheine-binding protein n=1 Tax=Amycolatopsis halotolerans TaxID=330083 RepID=A0ABV7QAR5_9PSEU